MFPQRYCWIKKHSLGEITQTGPPVLSTILFVYSSFDAFLTHLLSLWFYTNSCQPLTGSFCQALFPRTFKSVFNIPGRVNSENDAFDILAEVAPFLDYTCKTLMYLNVCLYINPLCSENGKRFLWSKSFTALNNIMASF